MSIIYIKNKDLNPVVLATGVIDIYKLTNEDLESIGMLVDGLPSDDFKTIIKDINKMFPTEYEYQPGFLDPIEKGYSLYNRFLENGENE